MRLELPRPTTSGRAARATRGRTLLVGSTAFKRSGRGTGVASLRVRSSAKAVLRRRARQTLSVVVRVRQAGRTRTTRRTVIFRDYAKVR